MAHDIEIRKIPFNFADIPPVWHPTNYEWSHMINGASLTMPYLEPFLNRTMREALPLIDDPDLKQDIDGFIRQEAQHFTNHRRYNEMLKQNGYPELTQVEATYEADYAKLEQRSLQWRLAYSAGFETMTMGVTEWLINERNELFKGGDPTVASFVLWHMIEETEHKSVAIDVYQQLCGKYWLRIMGLVWGSFHVGFMSRRAYRAMMKRDGQWQSLTSRIRLWKMIGRFFVRAGAAMIRALSPSYHPDRVEDPAWVDAWRVSYARFDADVPLLDTSAMDIKPEFSTAG